jgi:hypothetical protein
MSWVELEGNFFNTADIEAVRQADPNNEGFHTELVLVAGMQLLRMTPNEAIRIISSADK